MEKLWRGQRWEVSLDMRSSTEKFWSFHTLVCLNSIQFDHFLNYSSDRNPSTDNMTKSGYAKQTFVEHLKQKQHILHTFFSSPGVWEEKEEKGSGKTKQTNSRKSYVCAKCNLTLQTSSIHWNIEPPRAGRWFMLCISPPLHSPHADWRLTFKLWTTVKLVQQQKPVKQQQVHCSPVWGHSFSLCSNLLVPAALFIL